MLPFLPGGPLDGVEEFGVIGGVDGEFLVRIDAVFFGLAEVGVGFLTVIEPEFAVFVKGQQVGDLGVQGVLIGVFGEDKDAIGVVDGVVVAHGGGVFGVEAGGEVFEGGAYGDAIGFLGGVKGVFRLAAAKGDAGDFLVAGYDLPGVFIAYGEEVFGGAVLKLALFHRFAPGLDGFVYGIADDDAIDGGGVAGFDGLQGAVLEDKVALFKGNGAGGFVAGQVGEIRVVLLDLVDKNAFIAS